MPVGTSAHHRRMRGEWRATSEDNERLKPERSTTSRRLLLAGVACIFGGEALCVLGPLKYEHVVHAVCHTVLYAGIGCWCLGVVLYLRGQSRAGQ